MGDSEYIREFKLAGQWKAMSAAQEEEFIRCIIREELRKHCLLPPAPEQITEVMNK